MAETTIAENPFYRSIKSMIAKCTAIWVFKFEPVSQDSCIATYLNQIRQMHEYMGRPLYVDKFSQNTTVEDNIPHIAFLGYKVINTKTKAVNKKAIDGLVKMILDCPEGELKRKVKEAFDRHWGGDKNFKPFYEKATEFAKAHKGKLFRMTNEPRLMLSYDMKWIAEHFLAPRYESNESINIPKGLGED